MHLATGSSKRQDNFLSTFIHILKEIIIQFKNNYKAGSFKPENEKRINKDLQIVTRFEEALNSKWTTNPELAIETINIQSIIVGKMVFSDLINPSQVVRNT